MALSLVASRRAFGHNCSGRSSGRTHVDAAGLDGALDGGIGGRRIPTSGGTGTHDHDVTAGRLEGNRTTASTTAGTVATVASVAYGNKPLDVAANTAAAAVAHVNRDSDCTSPCISDATPSPSSEGTRAVADRGA